MNVYEMMIFQPYEPTSPRRRVGIKTASMPAKPHPSRADLSDHTYHYSLPDKETSPLP